jgi:hypothetical protein
LKIAALGVALAARAARYLGQARWERRTGARNRQRQVT